MDFKNILKSLEQGICPPELNYNANAKVLIVTGKQIGRAHV